jgi:uncharacterized protein YkwD
MVLVTKVKRPSSIHHKRRHGLHHKQTHEYHKTYWPYLPLGLIVGLGVLLNSFWPVVQQAVLGYATNTNISGLLDETNAQRTAGGLAALSINGQLNQAAQAKANDMAARNYWSHYTPDGSPPWIFFAQAGYSYQAAGENLAYGFDTSNTTVIAWMNSPGHKANIMNTGFKEVGFGIANVENYQGTGEQTIVVAMYGLQAAAAPAPTPAAKPTPTPASTPIAEATPLPETTAPITEPEIVTSSDVQNEIAPESARVARIQLLTDGAAPWSLFAVTALMTVAVAAFFLRHGLLWRRVLVKGESFIMKHHFLDIVLVLVGVLGFVLTRGAGSIH